MVASDNRNRIVLGALLTLCIVSSPAKDTFNAAHCSHQQPCFVVGNVLELQRPSSPTEHVYVAMQHGGSVLCLYNSMLAAFSLPMFQPHGILLLQVTERIEQKLLEPPGNPAKAVANLKSKIMALELPPLGLSHPPPVTVLLQHAREQQDGKRSAEPGKAGEPAGPGAKKQRVA